MYAYVYVSIWVHVRDIGIHLQVLQSQHNSLQYRAHVKEAIAVCFQDGEKSVSIYFCSSESVLVC